MKQERIYTITTASGMARAIIAGITEVGAGVTLTYNPSADISTDLNNLLTARGNCDQAKLIKTTLRENVVVAKENAQKFIRGTRDLFKMRWGNDYSERFVVLGFRAGFGVSDSVDDLQDMLQSIKSHFTANPTQEAVGVFTAAEAQALMEALNEAKNAVTIQEGEIENLMRIRDVKFDVLRDRITAVYQELRMQLDPLDARWLKFGFSLPGADETPEQVAGVKVTLIGPTAAAVKWEASERASYYRVWTKIHGSTDEYFAQGSPADLDFTIENLPANATIDIVVTAVNNGGESPVSDMISITTHA